MKAVFKATAERVNEQKKMKVTTGGFSFEVDEPKAEGICPEAQNPIETLLGALAACQSIVAYSLAPAFKINLQTFNVEAEGAMDTSAKPGGKIPIGLTEIHVAYQIKTDTDKATVEKFLKKVEAICPVGNTLAREVNVIVTSVTYL